MIVIVDGESYPNLLKGVMEEYVYWEDPRIEKYMDAIAVPRKRKIDTPIRKGISNIWYILEYQYYFGRQCIWLLQISMSYYYIERNISRIFTRKTLFRSIV